MTMNSENPAMPGDDPSGSPPAMDASPADAPLTAGPGAAGIPDSATAPTAPADRGPNPAIGAPPPPRERIHPPAVIHSLGDAHPGEANPAYAQDMAADGGPVHTAEAIAAREAAEEQLAAGRADTIPAADVTTASGVYNYQDSGLEPLPRDEQPGGRPVFSGEGEREPMEYMDAPHGHETLIGGLEAQDLPLNARIDAKVEANANQIERAESVSGLNFREGGDYERREFETPMPERDDILVGAGTGFSTIDPGPVDTITAHFAQPDQARAALRGLRDIGIQPEAITVTGLADDMGSRPAGLAEAVPAGEEAVRRSSTELPNDEDLPTTVAAQTAAPDDPATMARAGLARDEGLIARVEAPADAEIYSDQARSDADYRTMAGEGAAQVGESYSQQAGGEVVITVQADRITHAAVRQVLEAAGATAIHG